MSQTKLELEAKVVALTEFMRSEVYRLYLVELEEWAAGLRASILMRPPLTDQERAEVLVLHGHLARVSSETTIFEGIRNTFKAELDKMAESDTLVAQQNEENNNAT